MCEEFHEFCNKLMKNKDKKEVIKQMMLMDTKDFLFDVIKSEFNIIIFPIEITFGEYVIYMTSLKMTLFIVPDVLIFILYS